MVIFKGPEAIKQLLISESPGKPWDTFVLAAARISSGFRDLRVYNRGAPGLQKPQLLFQTKTDPRITYSNGNFLFSRKKMDSDGRTATIQGSMANGVNLYGHRLVISKFWRKMMVSDKFS